VPRVTEITQQLPVDIETLHVGSPPLISRSGAGA
jgi:hypothetical protein